MTFEAARVAGFEDLDAVHENGDLGADVDDADFVPDVGADLVGFGFGDADEGAGFEVFAVVVDLEFVASLMGLAQCGAAKEDTAVTVSRGFVFEREFVVGVFDFCAEPGVGTLIDGDDAVDHFEVRAAFVDPAGEVFSVEEIECGEEEEPGECHEALWCTRQDSNL